MSSLKQKTITGVFWGSINNFSNQGIQFVIGIILARLLSPREFGLVGMLTVFIAISESFINSGLNSALIRKKKCTQADYSTVFFYNLFVAIILYLVLFFSAPAIARFFNELELESILKVSSLVLIIYSLTIIQGTITTKRVDFKLYAKISVISGIGSGLVAIYFAYRGFGVWSLVGRSLIYAGLHSFFLWIWNSWRPSLVFSKDSFRDLFGFGSKILGSALIGKLFQNLNTFAIGKFFSAAELGFFKRAENFSNLPSQNINTIISKVSYPILSQLQDNPKQLKAAYKKLIFAVTFSSFILLAGMAAIAEPMIILLIGEKWKPSIVFLQMLCFPGMLYPLQALNLNVLNVTGRSDLYLKLTLIKSMLRIPFIIIGVILGIHYLVGGLMILAIIEFFINSFYSGKLISYPIKEQIADIIPSFVMAIIMAIFVFMIGFFIPFSYGQKLVLQIISGALFVVCAGELFKIRAYGELKEISLEQFKNLKSQLKNRLP